MSIYKEYLVTLDSLDVAHITMLINRRIDELKELKKGHKPKSIPAMLADEQLAIYAVTLDRLKNKTATS